MAALALVVPASYQGTLCRDTKEYASRDYISSEDLDFFLEGESAKRAMRVLDTDGDGRISLAEMRDAVIAIYRERKNLAFTLKARTHLSRLVPAGAWVWSYGLLVEELFNHGHYVYSNMLSRSVQYNSIVQHSTVSRCPLRALCHAGNMHCCGRTRAQWWARWS